ncbi:MAG: hypothetical protein JW768_02600 [Chitinispirillaceae bacterium]|nr:hypothetical protein [Chitinispirillaceae bacterium]
MLEKNRQNRTVSKTALSLVSVLLFMSSCATKQDEARDSSRNLDNTTASFIYNAIPRNDNARISPQYSTAINTFSVTLLRTVYATGAFSGKNLILSPFSVSRNLAVIAEGTVGESKQELLDALGGQTALDHAKDALSQLLYGDNSVILQCADALWIDSTKYSLKTAFRDTVTSKYGVEVAGSDFGDVSGTVSAINNWISSNTNNCINEIIGQNDIDPLTVAFIANAIYFEADWASPFDITKTEKQDFFAPTGPVSVDMMQSKYHHETHKTDTCENVKLYYGTDEKNFFYLDLYMPTAITVSAFLETHCLAALGGKHATTPGCLKMPKFFFTTEVELIPMLKELGIQGIFDPAKGEMTEMINGSAPDLHINKVKHKAGIKTDEEGTKAYAATVARAGLTGIDPSPDVVIDKPFVYFIRAGENGLVLFAGVVNDPSE